MKGMKEIRDQHIRIRTTIQVSDRLDQLVEHFQKISMNKVTKTDVVEFAINELYKTRIEKKR